MAIPVTVFTGFLGSGKTTIILNLIKQLPKDYKMVLLKNEFGNIAVDSKLAEESNLAVTEMLNGCLCCILVGKLGNALEEILAKYKPDRIIIETSGSAYPAPIAWEIRKLGDRLKLDGIITVIDALNFSGYKDRGYTAKIQAQYTDLILINKQELTDPDKLDRILDDVYELNASTPKIPTDRGFIDQKLIFGLDSKLFTSLKQVQQQQNAPGYNPGHQHDEVELMEVHTAKIFNRSELDHALTALPKWDFFRIKGPVNIDGNWFILNYAFGSWEYIPLSQAQNESELSIMGKNFSFHSKQLAGKLGLKPAELVWIRD